MFSRGGRAIGMLCYVCGQGGRQEFEIGVAQNKVGQKYPNKDIFEASGQKTRRPDGQKTG